MGDCYSIYLHYKQLNLEVHQQNYVGLQHFYKAIKVLIKIKYLKWDKFSPHVHQGNFLLRTVNYPGEKVPNSVFIPSIQHLKMSER